MSGIFTDRTMQALFLYVSWLEFLRTDSIFSEYVRIFIRILTCRFYNFLNMSVIQIKFINIKKTSRHIVKNMV